MSERRGSNPVFTMDQICHLEKLIGATEAKSKTVVALVLVHASWNSFPSFQHPLDHSVLKSLMPPGDDERDDDDVVHLFGSFSLDHDEDSMACAIGDDDYLYNKEDNMPIPPDRLPVLALAAQTPSREHHARVRYITEIPPNELIKYLRHSTTPESAQMRKDWSKIIYTALTKILSGTENPAENDKTKTNGKKRAIPFVDNDDDGDGQATRIFIAGDRSSVGKSSVCLGLLGNLIQLGYAPSQLAYIKPATQCEAPQLVQAYCESVGIACEAVGPLVYYKGFTRAFLAGETGQTTEDLLHGCGQAVDAIAQGKKVVLVDGVGFPAVGSICGTDNASVSKACGYPMAGDNHQRHPMGVVIVGGSGVGAAVDSFNLNAAYFEMAHVPVMGGIFNKLSMDGYYSLENCRAQLTSYFRQNERQQSLGRVPFGFVPLYDKMAGDDALQHIDGYVKIFGDHVDIQALLQSARCIKRKVTSEGTTTANMEVDSPKASQQPLKKRMKAAAAAASTNKVGGRNRMAPFTLSRKDVEQLASQQGAAGTA